MCETAAQQSVDDDDTMDFDFGKGTADIVPYQPKVRLWGKDDVTR